MSERGLSCGAMAGTSNPRKSMPLTTRFPILFPALLHTAIAVTHPPSTRQCSLPGAVNDLTVTDSLLHRILALESFAWDMCAGHCDRTMCIDRRIEFRCKGDPCSQSRQSRQAGSMGRGRRSKSPQANVSPSLQHTLGIRNENPHREMREKPREAERVPVTIWWDHRHISATLKDSRPCPAPV